jgi:pimeloyl-ACP methyl ester carboxylesterase
MLRFARVTKDDGIETIVANGVRFAYLGEGKGPLVLLLHGFPDTAHTWDEARSALARAGYRAVAPFMRGYAPSALAPDGRYDPEALGRDAIALIRALGSESAILVGHDWGALTAYAAACLDADAIRCLVTVGIPHPASMIPTLGIAWRGRHFVRLKLPGAVGALRANDFAMADELVRRWSPAWKVPAGETHAVKKSFRSPGSTEAAVAYYRQFPARLPRFFKRKIAAPSIAFAGETDGVLRDVSVYERARSRFTGPYEVVRMPGGHFMHREDPERFARELVRALTEHAPVQAQARAL